MATLKRATEYIKRNGANNRDIYQSYRWQKTSRNRLKSNRLCVRCLEQGKTVVARCTDHIIPIEEGGAIWEDSNMQSLCFSCHSTKTIEDKKKYSKPNH